MWFYKVHKLYMVISYIYIIIIYIYIYVYALCGFRGDSNGRINDDS